MNKPDWGCDAWDEPGHNWLECKECLDAYNNYMIFKGLWDGQA